MAILSGIFRIGRDPVMSHTTTGDPVLTLVVVYNYGKKDKEGKRPSQWIDVSLYGKRALALQPYISQGSQVSLVIQDPHVETYQTKDGREGKNFTGQVLDIELVSGNRGSNADAVSNNSVKQQSSKSDNDYFDSEIPF